MTWVPTCHDLYRRSRHVGSPQLRSARPLPSPAKQVRVLWCLSNSMAGVQGTKERERKRERWRKSNREIYGESERGSGTANRDKSLGCLSAHVHGQVRSPELVGLGRTPTIHATRYFWLVSVWWDRTTWHGPREHAYVQYSSFKVWLLDIIF